MNVYEKRNDFGKFLTNVYLWMFIGLLVSFITAHFVANSLSLINFVQKAYIFVIILELLVVILFSSLINKVSSGVAKIMFLLYSFINGLTLSSIFIYYKLGSITTVFIVSAIMFGLMAFYGHVTKNDLSSFGKMLIFGLLAIIILSLINIFVRSSGFSITLCVISVVLFLGLTAYDMQTLRKMYYNFDNDEDINKLSIFGALNLYLDFINIFIELLRLFGKSKD